MKIKYKLIMTMTSVVILMMGLFIFMIQTQFFIARDLAYFSDQQYLETLEKKLLQYYRQQQSWQGIAEQPKLTELPFVLLDENDQVIWHGGNEGKHAILAFAFPMTLQSNEQQIGRLYVLTPKQQQVYLMKKYMG